MDDTSNLNEIVENVDMIEVMEGYIDLERKKDNQYIAICPFHEDRNPSFSVNPIKGVYHCFGCGASGNLISFLEQINNEDFIATINRLSKISGIKFNQRELTENEKKMIKRHDIINQMQDIMQHSLFSKEFKDVLDVIKSRGLNEEQIKASGLGYCDENRIKKYFRANDIPLDLQLQTKLVDVKGSHVFYPIKNRITFPIKNIDGQIIGFSGGRIDQETQPKYKHSIHLDEGPGFFYQDGYSIVNSKITIVEGFYDQISLSVSGIKNVVATLGTTAGASDDKVKSLLTKSNDFVICMDGDLPGLKSAAKMSRLLKDKNDFKDSKVSLVFLPNDLDPDDYRRKFGSKRLKEIYQKKRFNEAQFRSKIETKEFLNHPTSKEDLIKNIVKNLKFADDDVQKELFISEISNSFRLSEDAIQSYYDKWCEENNDNETETEQQIDFNDLFESFDSISSELDSVSIEPDDVSLNAKESALISYIIKHPEEIISFEDPEIIFHHKYALNSLRILRSYYHKKDKIDVKDINRQLKDDFAVEQMFIKKSLDLNVTEDEYHSIIDELINQSKDNIQREELLKDLQSNIEVQNDFNIDKYLDELRESEDLK